MFLTFEGIEGCGKSTQARRIAARLAKVGVSCVLTFEPGGTDIGRKIRKILLDQNHRDLTPLAELFLYEADRAQHVAQVIRPALARKAWVVCDRFFDATIVYQGMARKQDLDVITFLNRKASFGIMPDLTFVIDLPVAIGLGRALKRNALNQSPGQDRFENEDREFHAAVRSGYLSLAKEEPERFVVVDGRLDEDTLEDAIFDHVRPYLNTKDGQ